MVVEGYFGSSFLQCVSVMGRNEARVAIAIKLRQNARSCSVELASAEGSREQVAAMMERIRSSDGAAAVKRIVERRPLKCPGYLVTL